MCDHNLISIMGLKIMNIIDLIVVFCACNDVTHKAERKWSATTYQGLEILSRKRSENLAIATGLCLLALKKIEIL